MSAVLDFPVRPEALPLIGMFAARPDEPAWLTALRKRGLARFGELGLPSRRSEAWRYLDLGALDEGTMLPMPARAGDPGAPVRDRLAELAFESAAQRLVLIDGRVAPELSSVRPEPGVWFGSLAAALSERPELVGQGAGPRLGMDSAFAALNAAFFADGFVLAVEPGVQLGRPLHIIHIASGRAGGAIHTRSLIELGAGSRASLIETFAAAEPQAPAFGYWRNDVVEIRLAASAGLDRVVLVEEGDRAVRLGEAHAVLGAKARLCGFALLLDGRAIRDTATVLVEGEGANCQLDGAFVIGGRQQANIVTTVDHAAPGGVLRELVKGVAADRAQGAFQGRVIVREGAQKVDAQQTSRNLLLGDRAVIDAKPELEIYADDVKCAHGATVGDLDEASLFYLMARGIPADEARRMLIDAFVRDAVERVEMPSMREHLLERLAHRLGRLES